MAPPSTSIAASSVPTLTISTPTPATPSATEEPRKRGLTLTTTIGVGIGIAVLCIIIFAVVFVCIRRRRRKWGKKRKEQGEPEVKGDTPEEEIAKKVNSNEGDQRVEIADGEVNRAELAGGLGDAEKKERMMEAGVVGELDAGEKVAELGTESNAHELAVQEQPIEVGEGGSFVAELDGKEIERRKTIRSPHRSA